MPYTPDPDRVRELATQLIMHGARTRNDANDVLANIAENEQFSLGPEGDANWAVLMKAVESAADTAAVSISFPA